MRQIAANTTENGFTTGLKLLTIFLIVSLVACDPYDQDLLLSDIDGSLEAPTVMFSRDSIVIAEGADFFEVGFTLSSDAIKDSRMVVEVSGLTNLIETEPAMIENSILVDMGADGTGSFLVKAIDNSEYTEFEHQLTFEIVYTTEGLTYNINETPKMVITILNDDEMPPASPFLMRDDFVDRNNVFDKSVAMDTIGGEVPGILTKSWIRMNDEGNSFLFNPEDKTVPDFVGNGVGGSYAFDNMSTVTFLNYMRRFREPDSIEDEFFSAGTTYLAFNLTVDNFDDFSGYRALIGQGKSIIKSSSIIGSALSNVVVLHPVDYEKGLYTIGVSKENASLAASGVYDDNVTFNLGQTYLVVLKVVQPDGIDKDSEVGNTTQRSNASISLYAFEGNADGGAKQWETEPETPIVEDSEGLDTNVNAVIMTASNNKYACTFDGIRVAETWDFLFCESTLASDCK